MISVDGANIANGSRTGHSAEPPAPGWALLRHIEFPLIPSLFSFIIPSLFAVSATFPLPSKHEWAFRIPSSVCAIYITGTDTEFTWISAWTASPWNIGI